MAIDPVQRAQKITLPYTIGDLSQQVQRLAVSASNENISPEQQKVRDYAKDAIEQRVVVTQHLRGIWRLKELPGNKIATASYDKTAKIFSLCDDVDEWQELTLRGHKKEVLSLDYYDENTLITGSSDGLLKFWNIRTGKQINSFGEPKKLSKGFYSLTVLDSNTIATGSCQRPRYYKKIWNHQIKLWDVATHKVSAVFHGHTGGISSLTRLMNGERLLSTSGDKTVRIWDIEKQENVSIFKGHTDYIYCAASLKNEQIVATGGRDRAIKLWDLETGQFDSLVNQGDSVAHESTIYDLAPFQDNLLISGSRDCQVRIWDIRTHALVRTIDTTFFTYAVCGYKGDIIAAGPESSEKTPQEGGNLAIFKFV